MNNKKTYRGKRNFAAPKPTQQAVVKKRTDGYITKLAPKAISRVRMDIASWKNALRQADNVDTPKRAMLQKLYKDIMLDALLTSQLENRKALTLASTFLIKNGGNTDENTTALLKSAPWFSELISHVIDSQFYGTTLIEFLTDKNGVLKPTLYPRTNVIPEKGILLYDESSTTGVDYRNAKEYGSWLIEFGKSDDYGILNKAIPHVLFKRFAQSCWSELCEIYGIPPRVMKTNTQDTEMLGRAEQMMRDMGAAAWFIIDQVEEFEFAKGVDTNGDVYNNLIRLCNNENSLLVSGAVIGQDTKNGNESKEKISKEQLENRAESDKRLVAGYMNTVVLPALYLIGLIPEGITFEFEPQEDIQQLYTRTIGFMQYMEPDVDWVNEKFGMNFKGVKQTGGGTNFQQPPQD